MLVLHDVHPPMRFSLTIPPKKDLYIVPSPTNRNNNNGIDCTRRFTTGSYSDSTTTNINNNMHARTTKNGSHSFVDEEVSGKEFNKSTTETDDEAASDYNQWLHAMKLVARLPGGMPPEFRRKLWLTLADKYLKSRKVDWSYEEKKCFSEEWREDDEELGIQIVKDLHRTGSNICSGPAAQANQAKLKRILLGYARYSPEVGYCQGFNMLGALILQVMEKDEVESMKVMIYLVEGILPAGYFCGSMGGLQADMGVFRELMQTKLPRLAKHLEKLQGPLDNAYEPPLTNVFTMQWFLTMFCTCLPMTCVLRVWDLVLIEGSDVLLRTALVLWSLLEERVLNTKSADDFYGKMGSFAGELLNGHLIDSNNLIEKVVQLGPISDINRLRNKHLYNIKPMRHKANIPLFLGDEEPENDEQSRIAIATVWGMPWMRRGSQGLGTSSKQAANTDNKERLAVDISLLKKQYDRLRERQKQAHIIITTACSTACQGATLNVSPSVMPVNQLLIGRSAIVTKQGKRNGPLTGAIPPARKPSLPTILRTKPNEKQLKPGETLHWRDTDLTKRRRDSLTWKEIKADRAAMLTNNTSMQLQTKKLHKRGGRSDSSSYSEESDNDGSSPDTSLCDDDPISTGEKSSTESSPKRRNESSRKQKGSAFKQLTPNKLFLHDTKERVRPKSWAPSSTEIPFVLMTTDPDVEVETTERTKYEEDSTTECDRHTFKASYEAEWPTNSIGYSPIAGDLATNTLGPLNIQTDGRELPIITSTSQLSPMPDIISYLKGSSISPLPPTKPSLIDSTNSLGSGDDDESKKFDVSDDGVTNQYFERINNVECPMKLDLSHTGQDRLRTFLKKHLDESIKMNLNSQGNRTSIDIAQQDDDDLKSSKFQCSDFKNVVKNQRSFPLEERDNYIPGENVNDLLELDRKDNNTNITATENSKVKTPPNITKTNQKRQDPRRLNLTKSSTVDIDERFQALEKRIINENIKRAASIENSLNTKKSSSNSRSEGKDETKSTDEVVLLNISIINAVIKDLTKHEVTNSEYVESNKSKRFLPSTDDLELRFKRQMSASTTQKRSPLIIGNNETGESVNSKKQSKKESLNQETEKGQQAEKANPSVGETSFDISEKKEEVKTTKSKLRKLPTTEELEDRFNALERNKSTEVNILDKSLKKPPDIEIKKKCDTKNVDDNFYKNSESYESNINKPSGNFQDQRETPTSADDSSLYKKKSEQTQKKKTPPTTEELEKRFKALEKQISSSNLENDKKSVSKHQKNRNEHIDPGQPNYSTESDNQTFKPAFSTDTIEIKPTGQMENMKEHFKTDNDNSKATEENFKSLSLSNQDIHKETDHFGEIKVKKRRSSEPPPTHDIEKHEQLKRRMSDKANTKVETMEAALESTEQTVIQEKQEHLATETHNIEKTIDLKETKQLPIKKDIKEILSAESNKRNSPEELQMLDKLIPEAPTFKKHEFEESATIIKGRRERQTFIEELQSKIRENANESTLRPSCINPNRKIPLILPGSSLHHKKSDETSETHALHRDFIRSKNHEPWNLQTQKMVRRFSDLTSRADLENRLEFLEQKFYRKLYSQRCASDSEVASRKTILLTEIESDSSNDQTNNLEKRIQALEKQLSENSLKLLEAMRVKTKDDDFQTDSLNKTSTETIDAAGKELVRYSHHCEELGEGMFRKPINISINIKMMVDEKTCTKSPEKLITTTDLEKRLEDLEQRLKISIEARSSCEGTSSECKEKKIESYETNINAKELQTLNSPEAGECLRSNRENSDVIIEQASVTIDKDAVNTDTGVSNRNEKSEPLEKEEKITNLSEDINTPNEATELTDNENKSINQNITSEQNAEIPKIISAETNEVDIKTLEAESNAPNKKTLVLLLDNEPKAIKVRRLTRANTEELEGLFQALEKQLIERNLVKTDDGKLQYAHDSNEDGSKPMNEQSIALSNLTKGIEIFTKTENGNKQDIKEDCKTEEPFDWGPDPVKRHLKRRTAHLPSTKELEARFRSLERQIRLLEDVEKIDVEQRLQEIERKIKLQYSLAHEKDLTKFLELCDGKGLNDDVQESAKETDNYCECGRKTPSSAKEKTPHTSPAKSVERKSPQSPGHALYASRNATKPSREKSRSKTEAPISENFNQIRSRSKDRQLNKEKYMDIKRQPIHLLEMLLDPSPDNDIPTTGELEHRIRLLDEKRTSPTIIRKNTSPPLNVRSNEQHSRIEEKNKGTAIPTPERLVLSPEKPEPPTVDELEARMRALEDVHSFDCKTQKNFKEFNDKLKNVISPSLEEYKSRDNSPKRILDDHRSPTPKSYSQNESEKLKTFRSTSPKVLRFEAEHDQLYRTKYQGSEMENQSMVGTYNGVLKTIEENSKTLQRILKMTIADSCDDSNRCPKYGIASSSFTAEGLNAEGSRLMRKDSSPLRRTGTTHTGIPLRTADNIDERLSSIKDTIKSINSLCEEKLYHKEKCQRYIDSLFSDSVHFAQKKSSFEELRSRSASRTRRSDYAPAIHIYDSDLKPSDYLTRSIGSAESLRTTSPLRAVSPLQYRSHRDLSRKADTTSGHQEKRSNEEREAYESRHLNIALTSNIIKMEIKKPK